MARAGGRGQAHVAVEDLSAYVDGELAAEALHQVEAHLRQCSPCRAAVRDYRSIGVLVRMVATQSIPAPVGRDLLRRHSPAASTPRQRAA